MSVLVERLGYSMTKDMLGTMFIFLETLEEDPDDQIYKLTKSVFVHRCC